MTANDDLERRIADYYETEAAPRAPDWLLASTLANVDTTPQRRALIALPWRLPHMNTYAKAGVAIVAVIAVVAVGLAFFRAGSPSGVGAVQAPSPAPTMLPTLPLGNDPVAAGRHALAPGFPVPITLDVPAGWVTCSPNPVEQAVCSPESSTTPSAVGVSIVVNVVADPCAEALQSPPVGQSVDDLVAAISGLDTFQATAPTAITLDGYAGKQFDLTAPARPSCGLLTWATADRTNGVGPGEVNLVRILDVGGVRVLIAGAYHPSSGGASARAQVEQILDSVHIGR
jgi:hypothetical protein